MVCVAPIRIAIRGVVASPLLRVCVLLHLIIAIVMRMVVVVAGHIVVLVAMSLVGLDAGCVAITGRMSSRLPIWLPCGSLCLPGSTKLA